MRLGTEKNQGVKPPKVSFFSHLAKLLFARENTGNFTLAYADETKELIESIQHAKKEWEAASMNFEYASDQQVVEYYAYKIKACEVRYAYLIRKAKERGITMGVSNEAHAYTG